MIADTPLLMMTSLGQMGFMSEFNKTNISHCLTKPVKQSRLYNLIISILLKKGILDNELKSSELLEKVTIQSARLLVAEDYPINQQVILSLLNNSPYAPSVARR